MLSLTTFFALSVSVAGSPTLVRLVAAAPNPLAAFSELLVASPAVASLDVVALDTGAAFTRCASILPARPCPALVVGFHMGCGTFTA